MTKAFSHMDPFLSEADAATMQEIAESFGSFGTYANEATSEGLGEDLPQRFDAGLNYLLHGIDGAGNPDDPETAASRTNYFRETYAYGSDILAPGIKPFLDNETLQSAAVEISGVDRIVPAIVYANLLVPGQELSIHTDVPEFLGANRKCLPQWLLVCMLHSGLFDQWRIPILTCVSWFGSAEGGAFTFYPQGVDGDRESIPARHNTAILLDTDKVFHGVERVAKQLPGIPPIGQATKLHHSGGDRWQLREGSDVLAEYRWEDIRYSISWKAYCFEDAAAERRWREGSEDLSLEQILAIFEAELRERGLLTGDRPGGNDFALMMSEAFIKFPGSALREAG